MAPKTQKQPDKPVVKTGKVLADLSTAGGDALPGAAAAPPKAEKTKASKRDRSTLYAPWVFNGEQTITMLVSGNPKAVRKPNGKAAARFALYQNGMKVSDLLAAYTKAGHKKGKLLSNVRWDIAHGLIKVA